MTDPLLQELRERFRESSRARLEEIAPLLGNAADPESLQKLARHFHAFAGLGATYGFPRVSELGDEAEGSILPLVRHGEVPGRSVIARWYALCEEIRFELNQCSDGRPRPSFPPAETAGSARKHIRILAVEDDATHAVLLRHVLGTAGYEVEVCSDPRRFDDALNGFAPDLLLTDVQLAEDDRCGYELVRRVRQHERFRELPVIFVSGDEASETSEPRVTKPVDWTRLLALIESRLG